MIGLIVPRLVNVRAYPDQIMTQLFRYPVGIVLLLIIKMYVSTRVLRHCEQNGDTVCIVSNEINNIIQWMLGQVRFSCSRFSCK